MLKASLDLIQVSPPADAVFVCREVVDVALDDPKLIDDAGLVPLIALAEQICLPELVADHLTIVDAANSGGANPHAKVMSLVAGMAAGTASIEDIAVVAGRQPAGVRADAGLSTLGTLLRAFTHRHVQQLKHGAASIADRPGHGYAKQGGEHGRG